MSGQRPRLLDLFCGAGGAAVGYHRAGFDVVGVDITPQPRYPFEFHQADALAMVQDRLQGCWHESYYKSSLPGMRPACLGHFDAIHASPVCKDHSKLRNATKRDTGTGWMLAETRRILATNRGSLPWVIENVAGADMRSDYRLCGCMFDLPGLRRERWFETSWRGFQLRPPCHHVGETVTVSGHGAQGREYKVGIRHDQERRRRAMGIDWMNRDELAQAIPPVFTEFIGEQLLAHLAERAA